VPRSWIDSEPGLLVVGRQVGLLYRRAAQRPFLTIGLTLLLTSALLGVLAFKKRTFAPEVVLRAIESDAVLGAVPRAKKRLRDHVRDAVFSNQHLAEVMDKYGLYPSLARNNPQAALETFKDDIDVEVYRNYFVEERVANSAPRSARIAISYRSSDRRLALDVARDLAQLVADNETKSRAAQFTAAAERAGVEVARARSALLEARGSLEQKMLLSRAQPTAQANVEIMNLQRSLPALERRVDDAEARQAGLELQASMESEQLGLRFELADAGAIPESAVLHLKQYVLFGLFAFAFGLPLVGLAVGAFDRRVRYIEDLDRLGVKRLGKLRIKQSKPELTPRAERLTIEGYA
jgi:hypothetical protein